MFKEQYGRLHEQISPRRNFVHAVIAEAGKLEKKKRDRQVSWKKPVTALAGVCVCIYMGMPALTASADSVYRLMYLVSPGIAQHFMPVQRSDEDNGIRMEVESAYIHGSTAEIYITMQDLEGDRIDETTDLFDSYRINRPFDCTSHCEFAGYDESTKKASFLITISQWGGKDIRGDKITFSAGSFLSHKKTYHGIQIPTDLSAVTAAEQIQTVFLTGFSGNDELAVSMFGNDTRALVPNEPLKEFAVDGMDMTGIGYIDGKLHIQTSVTDPLSRDNHGVFYLKDLQGGKTVCSYAFSFTNGESGENRVDYQEEVFDVSKEELGEYVLCGDFWISGMLTEGDWRVTFPLEEME